MWATEEQINNHRKRCILKLISDPRGVFCDDLVRRFGVPRGTIINDVIALRAKGYPIQTFSVMDERIMMYRTCFQMVKPPGNTSAAFVAQHSQNVNTGGRPAGRQPGGYVPNAVDFANTMSVGQASGSACTNRRK